MIPMKGMVLKTLSQVDLGHLILVGSHDGPTLGLRVEVSKDYSSDTVGALFFQTTTQWSENITAVYGNIAEEHCLDLGAPEFALDSPFVSLCISKQTHDPRLGMLAIDGSDFLIYAAFGGFSMHRAWWSASSGKQATGDQRLVVDRWCVGLRDVEGKFTPQLRYPYKSREKPES